MGISRMVKLLCLSVLSFASLNAQNLIANPGFENGLTSWTVTSAYYWNTAVYSPDPTIRHSGNFGIRGDESNDGSLGALQQNLTGELVAGRTYVLSGWIKTQNVADGGGVIFGLAYVDQYGAAPADGGVLAIGFQQGTQDWTFYQSPPFTLKPMPSDTAALVVSLDFSAAHGTAWWDDLKLIQSCNAAQGPCITITMFDSHTLQVDVTAQFSQNAATSKSITVNTTINGVALQSILPLTSVTGTQSRSLFIDLAANNPQVPRFTDNQVFDVTATATENGAVVGTATKTGAEIPLPVVHVHGILTDCLGDRIPHSLFSYLKSIHPAYVEDDGVSDGTANNMLTPATHPYPTLVSFDYQSMKESVRLTGAALAAFIQSQVLANTWAAKVDVVAHSMGGIITRSAIAINGQGAYINRLILVGSPSEGSTLAPIALSFWGPSAKLVGLLLQQMIPGLDFVSVLNCIENGNQTTTQELLPTYPWYAGSASAVQGGQFPQPQPNPNPTLPTINQAGLDPRVAYYAIVASGEPTVTYLWGRSQLWPTDIASYSDFTSRVNAWGTGDGIVPIRSQRASDTSWPIGALRGQLNIFPDVGPVFHTAYFDQFQVQIDVETILWP